MILVHKKISSPIGALHILSNGKKLVGLVFGNSWAEYKKNLQNEVSDGDDRICQRTEKQLNEYFQGQRTAFDVPVELDGTAFQKQAWQSLMKIPYGKTISYGDQARQMRNPKAVRAVGGANGKNKICIIIPCHRVIGKDGSLTGFGGGIEIKKKLLQLEGVTA